MTTSPKGFAHMKSLIAFFASVIGLFFALILLYRWDSDTNHGFQFGYYADFNRVSNALASIPDITVTQSWHNCDVTLEEFGFAATVSSGEPIRVAVGERDHIRSLAGDALVQALKAEIQTRAQIR